MPPTVVMTTELVFVNWQDPARYTGRTVSVCSCPLTPSPSSQGRSDSRMSSFWYVAVFLVICDFSHSHLKGWRTSKRDQSSLPHLRCLVAHQPGTCGSEPGNHRPPGTCSWVVSTAAQRTRLNVLFPCQLHGHCSPPPSLSCLALPFPNCPRLPPSHAVSELCTLRVSSHYPTQLFRVGAQLLRSTVDTGKIWKHVRSQALIFFKKERGPKVPESITC